jgi:Ca2+-binding RTX toxin-like protein
LAFGDYYDGNQSHWDVYYDTGYIDMFDGYGISYVGVIPVTGTATSYAFGEWLPNFFVHFAVSGISVPMSAIVDAAATASFNDDAAILAAALAGPDLILGGPGDDLLFGLGGNDEIYGGLGADLFVYVGDDGRDTIRDFFGYEGDMIDLSLIDAKASKGGNQRFKYIGDNKAKKAGQLSYDGKKLLGNTDKDKAPEFKLKLPDSDLDKGDLFL